MSTKSIKYVVLPERPEGFICLRAAEVNLSQELIPARMPEDARLIAGMFFWPWSKTRMREDLYYLSTNRQKSHWLLWWRWTYGDWASESELYAYGPNKSELPKTAAIYLLQDAWNYDHQHKRHPGAFREIDSVGPLEVPQLEAIA